MVLAILSDQILIHNYGWKENFYVNQNIFLFNQNKFVFNKINIFIWYQNIFPFNQNNFVFKKKYI